MAMNAALNEDVEAFARRENRRLLAKRRNSNTFRRGERAHPRSRHDFTLLFSTVVASAIALFATPCAADCSYIYQGAPYWYNQWFCYSPFNNNGDNAKKAQANEEPPESWSMWTSEMAHGVFVDDKGQDVPEWTALVADVRQRMRHAIPDSDPRLPRLTSNRHAA